VLAGNDDSNPVGAGESLPWQFQVGIVARITAGSTAIQRACGSERLRGGDCANNPSPVSGRVLKLFAVCSTPMRKPYEISVAR
jgi:hypothetical protein